VGGRVSCFDALILAGGSGRRLGGVDKAALVVAGVPMLDRVLEASAAARQTVVVGEPRPTVRAVGWTREDPPGGGPVPALAAGLAGLSGLKASATRPSSGHAGSDDGLDERDIDTDVVVVLATDLPWLRSPDVERLVTALDGDSTAEAALFLDAEGRTQPLVAAYRTASLEAALSAVGPLIGTAVRLVVHQLAVVTVPDLGAAGDCDTPDQLAAARAHFDRQG
jgi:molybdopterin-guanine dinucleotide biosynthesis protein A